MTAIGSISNADRTTEYSQKDSEAFEKISLLDSLLIQSDIGYPDQNLNRWEQLKGIAVFSDLATLGPLDIFIMMKKVEQMVSMDRPLFDNVDQLFRQFAKELAPHFEQAQIPLETRPVTELQLIKLQAALKVSYENEALETIWDQRLLQLFIRQGAFIDRELPVGVAQIRTWLEDPANAGRIQGIRKLNLGSLHLKAVPSEIKLFVGLQELILSNNELKLLPESIGDLQNLKLLSLHNNQLRFLPESIGNLQSLEELYLSSNQLNFVSESVGKLRALKELALSENRLRFLPESIGDLQALRVLFLHNNQLSFLPESIKDLKGLRELYLSSNQLNFLPESIRGLKALRPFSLYGNPLMLFSDKEAAAISDYRKCAARLEELKKYTPQSPLAILFRTIGFNQPVELIVQAYRGLSVEMQERISVLVEQNIAPDHVTAPSSSSSISSSASSSSESSIDLFTDMELFARSVRRAAYDLYDSLGQEQKDLVHRHIWDLAGRPETDDTNWGASRVFDHALRFTDALERATRT